SVLHASSPPSTRRIGPETTTRCPRLAVASLDQRSRGTAPPTRARDARRSRDEHPAHHRIPRRDRRRSTDGGYDSPRVGIAFLADSMTPVPIGLAFAIAVGNTAEALLGWFLLTRIGFRNGLERVHDVIALVVGAAVLSTAVSATVGVTASLFAGTIASSTYL